MKTRTLKIEAAGDSWREKIIPKIRLTGQWLERAGFKPGNRVEIKMNEQGTLTLRFVEQSNPIVKRAVDTSILQESQLIAL